MKRLRVRLAALVCLLALVLSLPGPAAAAGTLYFSGEVREAVADLAKN